MKTKYLFIIILFSLLSSKAYSQRFKGGILLGMNASQIDGDYWSGFYKGGLLAGAFVNTELQDNWGAQLEIKYSAKGSAPHPDSPDYPMKIQLNYIDVPLIGTFEAVENLKLEAGISFNYLFSGKISDASGWNDFNDDGPNSFETSVLFGLNYRFFTRFDLNLRYNVSLVPISGDYTGQTFKKGAMSNHVISFALYFHLGNRDI